MTKELLGTAGAATLAGQPARGRWRFLALAFGPPAVWTVAQTWLEWQEGRHPAPDIFSISALPVSQSVFTLVLPGLLALLSVLLVGIALTLWWRRGGAQPVQRLLIGLWVLLWLAGAAALFGTRANRAHLGPLAVVGTTATAKVLGTRARMPDLHQPGGSELILAVDGLEGPQQVQISDLAAAQLRPGDAIALRWAPGRYYGRYLVAWERAGGTGALGAE